MWGGHCFHFVDPSTSCIPLFPRSSPVQVSPILVYNCLGFSLSFFLKTGVSLAAFQLDGTLPVSSLRLRIRVIEDDIEGSVS